MEITMRMASSSGSMQGNSHSAGISAMGAVVAAIDEQQVLGLHSTLSGRLQLSFIRTS